MYEGLNLTLMLVVTLVTFAAHSKDNLISNDKSAGDKSADNKQLTIVETSTGFEGIKNTYEDEVKEHG